MRIYDKMKNVYDDVKEEFVKKMNSECIRLSFYLSPTSKDHISLVCYAYLDVLHIKHCIFGDYVEIHRIEDNFDFYIEKFLNKDKEYFRDLFMEVKHV